MSESTLDDFRKAHIEALNEQIRDDISHMTRLAKQRDALLAACKAVEWVEVNHDKFVCCPSCKSWEHVYTAPELRPHNEGCQLAAAIAMTEGKE